MEEIEKHWQYGFISKGKLNINTGKYENYVNEKTINYIVKYITKADVQHKYYKSKVLCSDGIGKKYIHTSNAKRNIYAEGKTNETYITRSGHKIKLPMYYRNQLYNDTEKEKLWLEKLDNEERFVLGRRVSTKTGLTAYFNMLKTAQELNQKLGYGSNKKEWERYK